MIQRLVIIYITGFSYSTELHNSLVAEMPAFLI
jgi:hypothetical protein